jgi:hypothetical protein
VKTSTGPRLAPSLVEGLAGALFLFPAALARAQDQPVRITISGEIGAAFAARDGTINEGALWTPGGLPSTSPSRDHDTFVLPDLSARFDVEGTVWHAVLEIGNTPLEFDDADPRLQNDRWGEAASLEIDLRQAWVELYGRARLGAQDFAWDPGGRGHALFLEPSAAESPWGELPDSTVPPFPAAGTNTVPQTRRDTMHPVGLTVRAWDMTAFALAVGEGGPSSSDDALFGATFNRSFGGFRLGTVGSLMAGANPQERVWTAGASVGYDAAPFFVSAEGYLQGGTAGEVDTDGNGSADLLKAEGTAVRVLARVGGEWWLQGAFVRVSGDDDPTDEEEGRFLSYENNDATLIVEGNEFGFDIDTNYLSLQGAAGGQLTLLGKVLQPRVIAALFRLIEEVPLPPDPASGVSGRDDDLGLEVDAVLDVAWSPRVTLTGGAAVLLGAGVLEEFTSDREDRASLFTLGFRLRF